MFRVIMNNNVMDECRTYGQALAKAKKIKKIFCPKDTYKIIVEDSNGRILDRL